MRALFIILVLYCLCVIAVVGSTMNRTTPINPFAEYALWMPGGMKPLEVDGWKCEHFWDVYVDTHGHFYCNRFEEDGGIVRWVSVSGIHSRIGRTTFAVTLRYGDLVEWYGRCLSRSQGHRTGVLYFRNHVEGGAITAYTNRWDSNSGMNINIRYVSFVGVN